ncbi:MAG: hypothetical protein ACI82F_004658 [Planctomycetota bacterium]|jgi:hypothetical protein
MAKSSAEVRRLRRLTRLNFELGDPLDHPMASPRLPDFLDEEVNRRLNLDHLITGQGDAIVRLNVQLVPQEARNDLQVRELALHASRGVL